MRQEGRKICFPRYLCISFSLTKDYYRILAPHGWRFNFRKHLNDWEIQRVADFLSIIKQFNGLEVGQDILWWKGNERVSSKYIMLTG